MKNYAEYKSPQSMTSLPLYTIIMSSVKYIKQLV